MKCQLFLCLSEFREIHHLVDNLCTVAGLLPGKTYGFRIKAKNEVGVRVKNSHWPESDFCHFSSY